MDHVNSQPDDMGRLRSLLKEAGYTSHRVTATKRALTFGGRTREWTIVVRVNNGWFNAYTVVCSMPDEPGLRARTLETAMCLNARMSATKFVASDCLVLEVDYRFEHLDVESLRGLLGLLHANAEEFYPKIFRTVSGDDVLDALGPVALPSAAQGASA